MRSESFPSFLALFNECFFWSVLAITITGKKPTQRNNWVVQDLLVRDIDDLSRRPVYSRATEPESTCFRKHMIYRWSKFYVRRSVFGVRRSAFDVLRSAFGIRRSAFSVQRSAFCIWRSAFSVRRSAFGVQRSAFCIWRSAFSVRRSAFGVRRSAFSVRRSAFGVPCRFSPGK